MKKGKELLALLFYSFYYVPVRTIKKKQKVKNQKLWTLLWKR
ncbi:hypothetical protein [Bacillus pseudomycoides]|nr:hypothetical protein [Bacillus pseudomycoides]